MAGREKARLTIAYTLRDPQGRLVACVERDLAELLIAHIKPLGIGLLKTEAQVEKAIRAGIAAAFEALRDGR